MLTSQICLLIRFMFLPPLSYTLQNPFLQLFPGPLLVRIRKHKQFFGTSLWVTLCRAPPGAFWGLSLIIAQKQKWVERSIYIVLIATCIRSLLLHRQCRIGFFRQRQSGQQHGGGSQNASATECGRNLFLRQKSSSEFRSAMSNASSGFSQTFPSQFTSSHSFTISTTLTADTL